MRQALTAFVWPIYQVNNRTVRCSRIHLTGLWNTNCTCNTVTRCIDLLHNHSYVKLIAKKAILNLNWWWQCMNQKHYEGRSEIEGATGLSLVLVRLGFLDWKWLLNFSRRVARRAWFTSQRHKSWTRGAIRHESNSRLCLLSPTALHVGPHQSGMTRLINLIRRYCATAGPVSNVDWTGAQATTSCDQLFPFIKTTPLCLPYGC